MVALSGSGLRRGAAVIAAVVLCGGAAAACSSGSGSGSGARERGQTMMDMIRFYAGSISDRKRFKNASCTSPVAFGFNFS